MNKLASFFILLLFSINGFAQNAAPKPPGALRFKTYADIERSAKVMRKHEKEIRSFYMQMILRKAQMDIAAVLNKKQMSELEIQKVMEGDAMKKFLSNLEKNPKIQGKVDMHVQKLLKPGAIETYVMHQRELLAQEMQEKTVIARNELQKSSIYRSTEDVFEPQDDRTLITKVWEHLVDDLYKD